MLGTWRAYAGATVNAKPGQALISKKSRALLGRADLAPAAHCYGLACLASRQHDASAARAFKQYGDHGPAISGCVRDHFPARVREQLRELARRVTLHSNAAWAARPARVRSSTMRDLGRAVAQRDGAGFYGPRP
jgi:hypothetical protein